ncbi:PKD domain-containing protein [Flavobacterium phycosphaerae]|uniref:PKD domain-containing protein n=1 Tax=Flavobacterium phycosphaerae TaxID=2697515 RepID=UPI001389DB80|nr:PKD domain-containing protein [Flavobacterium phycosphaerae]
MKKIVVFISIGLLISILGCSEDNNDVNLDNIAAPTGISALMTIKQDNSGEVTFLPKGEGVTQYEIYYGDGTTEPGYVNPGNSISHTYPEGVYQVKIVGVTLNGKRTEVMQELTVSFLAPTDLEVSITTGTNLAANVSASANLETYFQVYFGDVANEIPVDFMEGEVISHTYATSGTYTITVVALSGGAATTVYTQSVTVTNLLPAPTPTTPSSNVISMFSDAYTNVAVDTWKTSWSQANLDDITISGNATKNIHH